MKYNYWPDKSEKNILLRLIKLTIKQYNYEMDIQKILRYLYSIMKYIYIKNTNVKIL